MIISLSLRSYNYCEGFIYRVKDSSFNSLTFEEVLDWGWATLFLGGSLTEEGSFFLIGFVLSGKLLETS
jgi:hypothetical protein